MKCIWRDTPFHLHPIPCHVLGWQFLQPHSCTTCNHRKIPHTAGSHLKLNSHPFAWWQPFECRGGWYTQILQSHQVWPPKGHASSCSGLILKPSRHLFSQGGSGYKSCQQLEWLHSQSLYLLCHSLHSGAAHQWKKVDNIYRMRIKWETKYSLMFWISKFSHHWCWLMHLEEIWIISQSSERVS